MTLLLDTCTFLWFLYDDPRLPLRARTEYHTPSNTVHLSALSVWEITIKYRLGRLPLPESPELFVASRRQRLQIEPLPYDDRDARPGDRTRSGRRALAVMVAVARTRSARRYFPELCLVGLVAGVR